MVRRQVGEFPPFPNADKMSPANKRDLRHLSVHERNVVSPKSSRQGKLTVREADRIADTGGWKKRKPFSNRVDRE